MVVININVWLIFLNLICVHSVVHSAIANDGQDDGEFYMGAIVKFNITNKITGKSDEQGSVGSREIGRYGHHSPLRDVRGQVVHAMEPDGNNNGCSNSYTDVTAKSPWIALVQRGGCTFTEKINNAYNANASAIIVYDVNEELITMSHKGATNIVSVIIPQDIGVIIAKDVDSGNIVIAEIKEGRYRRSSYGDKTSIIFVSISFLILMVISLTWLIVYYVQRFRLVQSPDVLKLRRIQARKLVNTLPKKILKTGDKEIVGDEICPICIENYKFNDALRLLPCKHAFHRKCVDPWLRVRETCPMCKFDVLKSLGLGPPIFDPRYLRAPSQSESWNTVENPQTLTQPRTLSVDSLEETHEETVLVMVEDTATSVPPEMNSETSGNSPSPLVSPDIPGPSTA